MDQKRVIYVLLDDESPVLGVGIGCCSADDGFDLVHRGADVDAIPSICVLSWLYYPNVFLNRPFSLDFSDDLVALNHALELLVLLLFFLVVRAVLRVVALLPSLSPVLSLVEPRLLLFLLDFVLVFEHSEPLGQSLLPQLCGLAHLDPEVLEVSLEPFVLLILQALLHKERKWKHFKGILAHHSIEIPHVDKNSLLVA